MRFALNASLVRREWPPRGGWKYIEPATGWVNPGPMEGGFDATVEKILKHRKANPGYALSTEVDDIEADLMDQTARRIMDETPEHVARWVVALDEDAKKKSPQGFQPSQPSSPQPAAKPVSVVERILSRVRSIQKGVATLADWVGSGAIPVPPNVAERRAQTCISCPKNQEGGAITDAIADAIRSQTIVKNSLGLSTDFEDRLKTCSACGCNLRLKVWVPLDTIQAHTDEATKAAFDPSCWIRNEQRSVTAIGSPQPVLSRTITIRRKAAYGDVILASIIASRLNEIGIGVRMATEPVIARALAGHPHIQEFVDSSVKPDLDLDGAYETNLNRTRKDIGLLMLEAAQQDLRRFGIDLKNTHNRVPVLAITDAERWETLQQLQRFPRPWIVVVDGSGAWPNRQWDAVEVPKLARGLAGSLIWSKPWRWVRPPQGFCQLQVRDFRHLMAVIAHCDLVITPDTGPIHVAAAFHRPVVALEQCNDTRLRLTDLTDWEAVASPVDCVRCGHMTCPIDAKTPPCQKIPVEKVIEAARRKLEAYSNGQVTALIAVYRNREDVRRCIDQIVGQVDEVIVSLDGDQKPWTVPYAKVRFVEGTGSRTGYGRTIMRAARTSTSEFLLTLNDDCFADPGCVSKMREAMSEGVACVGALLRYPDGTIQHGGCFRPPGALGFGHIDHRKTTSRFTDVTEMETVTHAVALMRRSAFFEVGGYDERFDCYSEDSDLSLKMRNAGWRIVFQPAATAIHAESQTSSEIKMQLLQSSGAMFAAKWRNYLMSTPPFFCQP